MGYVPEATIISVFEMKLYQKNIALLQEKCASAEFQKLFPSPLGDEDLFTCTIGYLGEEEYPTLFYAGVNEKTKSIAVYFPGYLATEGLHYMLSHIKNYYYYDNIVVFCHETNLDEVKKDLTDWRPKKVRVVSFGNDVS